MLKKNDEKLNGLLLTEAFPFLPSALSYDRFAFSLRVQHLLKNIRLA
jgi:hypothetical protein